MATEENKMLALALESMPFRREVSARTTPVREQAVNGLEGLGKQRLQMTHSSHVPFSCDSHAVLYFQGLRGKYPTGVKHYTTEGRLSS